MVFITIPWFLPSYRAGGPIQSIANLVDNFNEGIEYRIFCGDTDLNGEHLTGIVKNEWTNYNAYTKVWYAESEHTSEIICREIEHIKPDVLYIIGLFSWHFNIVPLFFCKASRKIISARGMLHPGALSQKKIKKRLFLSTIKLLGVAQSTIFHATNSAEKQFIRNEFGSGTKVVVAGNFSKELHAQLPVLKKENYLTIVTIALISPMKNHLLVLQALKQCKAFVDYNIYGPIKAEAYWQQCLQAIELLPTNIKVTYHGALEPRLIEKVLLQQHVFIMPSKSENFGHAIAEALGTGKPVITSNNTPWNNLDINKAGMNVAANVDEIANAISFFASQDEITYNDYSKAAVKYAKQHLHTTDILEEYKRMFFEKI